MIRNLLSWLFSVWMAIFLALLYGLVAFFAFRYPAWKDTFRLMTVAYIFILPLVLGCITVYVGELKGRRSWWFRLFMPLVPVTLLAGLALLFAWEGAICIIMILPTFLAMAMVGGLFYGLIKDAGSSRLSVLVLSAVLFLPYAGAPLESRWADPTQLRSVETAIEIPAPAEKVWPQIIRVRKFEPEEHGFSLVHAIGFPRPVEATLSHPGVGGVRLASFEGGVVFVETIDAWEEGKSLSFKIAADPDSIPQKTLDEHVTVGGPFFDVLRGTYKIETLGPSAVRLHLKSDYRLTTPFNFYSSLWTDFIMRDIQNYILRIIHKRSL